MIITCTNLKGGCSKTTSAIALASAAAKKKEKTLVIDTDPQGSATEWAYLAKEAGTPLAFDVVSKNIQDLKHLYIDTDTYVFIDTPPTGHITDEAVNISDFVIIPVTPSSIDMRQTWTTLETLTVKNKLCAVLITRANRHTRAYKSLIGALDRAEAAYFSTVIDQREAIKNSFGLPFSKLYGYDKAFNELRRVLKDYKE